MKLVMRCLFGMTILINSLAIGGEGTLPFGAYAMSGQVFDNGTTEQLLLNFEPRNFTQPLDAREASNCPSNMEYYDFGGTITVAGVEYTVTTICATSVNLGDRIVIGEAGTSRIVLDGLLSKASQGYQLFEGTAAIINGRAARELKFSVSE
ncbi:hypothetical protein [Pseudobacteriovorax antillogorgiicola]|uniref:Uncharacterized protein n=1 Tax=Pseudobacteriovorax antillogorgiicola TaxID=1513793 RepID=A0A1Y6C9Q4_9BACT|nr:hypothetical protein [Pseudobacteriovorax antillogorgiicola]TCS51792.1 hypothetical protein EDD56_110177 [Pseudobacteriovorax antillogorgiicola]SMF50021.1 hypothetical protein SAMN06296036_115146 [Pseudobacteriovorax antillogorgiicola]